MLVLVLVLLLVIECETARPAVAPYQQNDR